MGPGRTGEKTRKLTSPRYIHSQRNGHLNSNRLLSPSARSPFAPFA